MKEKTFEEVLKNYCIEKYGEDYEEQYKIIYDFIFFIESYEE